MIEPVPLRVACHADRVVLQFPSAPERDRFLMHSGVHSDGGLLFAPDPRARNVSGHLGLREAQGYQHTLAFRLNLSGVPRFGPVEVEGSLSNDVLSVALPPVTELPWPRCWGDDEALQWRRSVEERLAYGIRTGHIRTQWAAARYLRETMPQRGIDAVRPVWYSLLEDLNVPLK